MSRWRWVRIPFYDRFREPMLADPQVKELTCRTSKKGRPGDRFRAFGAVFQIVDVWRDTAAHIAICFWREEGCSSPADFKATWRKIHPRLPWDRMVWVHRFRRGKR